MEWLPQTSAGKTVELNIEHHHELTNKHWHTKTYAAALHKFIAAQLPDKEEQNYKYSPKADKQNALKIFQIKLSQFYYTDCICVDVGHEREKS